MANSNVKNKKMSQSQFEALYRSKIEEYVRNAVNIPEEWVVPPELLASTSTNVTGFIEESSLLSPLELEITESSPTKILSNVHCGKWKSLLVVKAFAHRASIAQQLVNPLSEVFFDEAYERAKQLDEYLEKHSVPIGPLHGLPISIKDEFDLKGHRTSLGLVSQIDSPAATKTSPNIEILISQGAIPFVKTNVPTGAFNIVTKNNVYGATTNPYQTLFASGGSTGGEATLVALKGSPMGIGSDLGGSIRQPSSFTGLYGMKPTSNRVPHWNEKAVVAGLESLNGTNGCLCNTIDGIELYFKTIIESEPWNFDTRVAPIPWKQSVELPQKLKFGIIIDDGQLRGTPPIRRALRKVTEVLEAHGHEVVTFKPRDDLLVEIASFADKFMNSGGLKNFYNEIIETNEPIENIECIRDTKDLHVSQLWELQKERTLKVNEFWSYWKELGIDGLISPVTALAGCKFDEFIDRSYSPLANVIDFPSCVFPVLKTDILLDDHTRANSIHTRNDYEEKVWCQYYDAKLSDGVPIGLQLVGPRYQEEKVIHMTKLISSLLQ